MSDSPAPPVATAAGRPPGAPPFHKRRLEKKDGRGLWLYGREPIADTIQATIPLGGTAAGAAPPNPHLRFHPLRGEWIAYAGHRQNRTFLPPPEYNPLLPSADPANPTELPVGGYDVAVFENRFPTLVRTAHDPPDAIVETRPACGSCEVVVFTQDPAASLGRLPLDRIDLILEVWADRYRELGARHDVSYVFPFENRGVEVGVTLHHPHGQLYAYPFVPPVAARQLANELAYYELSGQVLLADLLAKEIAEATRTLYLGPHALAVLPVCARYPYEIWIAPRRAIPSLADLAPDERRDLARALKTALLKLDGLWRTPMPYILTVYQAPTDGERHPEAHAHIQIYPAYRMPGRLKYLAGSEAGAGVFTADTFPEDKARELREIEVSLD